MAKRPMDRSTLDAAASDLGLVRVHRSIAGADLSEGYVVGIGSKWLLLAVLDDRIVLDGYTAVRVDDIRKVRVKKNQSFVRRALEMREQWPPTRPPEVELDRTGDLIRSVAAAWPLVTFFAERDDPDLCYIGRPVAWSGKSADWLHITSQAEWDVDAIDRRHLRDVTRVDFGGLYEDALAAVAGPAPS